MPLQRGSGAALEDGTPMASRRAADANADSDIESGPAPATPSGSVADGKAALAPAHAGVLLECNIESFHPPGRHPPEILKDVEASFPPRSLTALLGQSGSGKTTLLNILSGRGGGTFRGALRINGRAMQFGALKHFANLVPQDDIMYDTLTVRETLLFYTRLRLPPQSAAATSARVQALLDRLGLSYAADVRIGNALKPGISGGQRKRLSIGMELIDNPVLLFLDEPTSGLDSRNQAEVSLFLRELSNDGCTVVTTIHSPSTQVYCRFDSVLLLVRNIGIGGGSLAFQGTVAEEIAFFASLGAPLPPFANPAEHALTCLDAEYGVLGLPTLWRLRRLHLLYQTVPDMSGASASAIEARLRALLQLAAHCLSGEGGDTEATAAPPADLPALARAIADGGGTLLAFVHAMVACLLASEPHAGAGEAHITEIQLPVPRNTDFASTSGSAKPATPLEALCLPHAAPAPAAVARLDDIARRMAASRTFTELYRMYAAAVARRMDISGPDAAREPEAAPPAERASEAAARMQRACDTGGWAWRLPAADVAGVLRALGYERAMALEPAQTAALVDALAVDGTVAFGELAAALFLHAHPALPRSEGDEHAAAAALFASAAAGDALDSAGLRRLLRAAFPAGLRLDGQQLLEPQLAAYARFLDCDGDGAVTPGDAAHWLHSCAALRAALTAAPDDTVAAAAAAALPGAAVDLSAQRPAYANNGFTQWRLLLKREFQMLFHDSAQVMTIIVMTVLIPLFLGGMYWRIDLTQKNFTNLVAALFLSCLFSGILPLNTTMLTFPREQVIVKREYSNGCYSSASYYAAKAFFLCLARGGQSVVVSLLIYGMAGIYPRPWSFENLVVFFFALCIVVIWSSCAGFMFGILVPNAESAAAVSMPFVLVQVLFSGFYLTRASIPPWFIWAYYISFFRYALAVLVKNLFHKLHFRSCGDAFCPFGPTGTGRDVERQYGVEGNSMAMLFGVCVGYAVLIFIIGYVALVLQLRAQLRRKPPAAHAPGDNAAARVLDLPAYALACQRQAHGEAPPAREAPRLLRRCFLRRRGVRVTER